MQRENGDRAATARMGRERPCPPVTERFQVVIFATGGWRAGDEILPVTSITQIYGSNPTGCLHVCPSSYWRCCDQEPAKGGMRGVPARAGAGVHHSRGTWGNPAAWGSWTAPYPLPDLAWPTMHPRMPEWDGRAHSDTNHLYTGPTSPP